MGNLFNRQHNGTVGGKKSSLYCRWQAMKDRCCNSDNKSFKDYGARGITVCKKWQSDFAAFQVWALASGYEPNLLLDRKDNDKGYSPGNCRWVTRAVSNVNKRQKYRPIIVNGVEGSYKFWAEKLGCPAAILRVRINTLGWSDERAVTTPVGPRGRPKGT